MVHIGEIIKKELKKSNLTVTEFAKIINTNRNNVYDIYTRKTIDTGLLHKIGETLNHDFFQYYISDETKMEILHDEDNAYITHKEISKLTLRIADLEKEIVILNERLKDKDEIISLLKKSNS